jgi:large subunit ribosomal protein L30
MTITLVRSLIGCTPKQRKVLAALGLSRVHKRKEYKDSPAVRGMIAKVPHMLKVVE